MIIFILLLLCCVYLHDTIGRKLVAFDATLRHAFHAAAVRFSLDSQ